MAATFMSTLFLALLSAGAAIASSGTAQPPDWIEAERGLLENHVQLTFPDRFIKAGEAYFSPDDSKIIFQAIETPREGEEPEAFFQMYVADVVYDAGRRITGIENILRLSPPGSWNTCGWFHPRKEGMVIFGSTIVKPQDPEKVGFQRGVNRYAWSFPKEMTIVECDLSEADGSADSLTPLVADPDAYVAECVLSDDGRYLVYCRRPEADGQTGGDLLIRDLVTGEDVTVSDKFGYDGGPFFSPDGRRLCYRSDRRGDNLLQVFVAELAFDSEGRITGVEREFQLTNNGVVNWAPYWTPDGRRLVYTTSALGHHNYEVFIMDSDPGNLDSSNGPGLYGTGKRQVTHAAGFDGLPAFNSNGRVMMWTSQRGGGGSSQLWAADFVVNTDEAQQEAGGSEPQTPGTVHVIDPDSGTVYVYDVTTHRIYIYDPVSHEKREVTDKEQLERAMDLFRRDEGGEE